MKLISFLQGHSNNFTPYGNLAEVSEALSIMVTPERVAVYKAGPVPTYFIVWGGSAIEAANTVEGMTLVDEQYTLTPDEAAPKGSTFVVCAGGIWCANEEYFADRALKGVFPTREAARKFANEHNDAVQPPSYHDYWGWVDIYEYEVGTSKRLTHQVFFDGEWFDPKVVE